MRRRDKRREEFISLTELAEILGYDRSYLYRLMKEGKIKIPKFRLSKRGRWRIPKKWVEEEFGIDLD